MQWKISKHSIFYNVAALSAAGLVLQLLGFVYRVYLNRMVGVEGLGVYRLLSPVSSVLIAATITGTKMAVVNISARYTKKDDQAQIRHLVRRCVCLFLAVFLTIAIPIGFFHETIALALGDARISAALVIVLFAIFFSGFEGIFEALYLGIGQTKYTAISNLIEQATQMVAVLLLLAVVGTNRLERTAMAMAGAAVISEIPVVIWLVFIYWRLMGKRNEASQIRRRPDRCAGHMWLSILSISLPVTVTAIVTNAIGSVSTIILPKRLVAAGLTHKEALSELGIISGMAMPLLLFPMVLVSSLASVIMPNLSARLGRDEAAAIKRKIRKSFEAVGLIGFGATFALMPVASPLSKILYHQELSIPYVMCLSICAIFLYFQSISISILNGINQQRLAMISVISGEMVQLLITWVLCANPQFGIFGYIIAMIAGCFVACAFNLFFIKKISHVLPSFFKSLFVPLLLGVVMGLFSRFFYHFFLLSMPEGAAIAIALMVAFAVGMIVLPVIGLNPLRYLQTLIPSAQVGDIPLKDRK